MDSEYRFDLDKNIKDTYKLFLQQRFKPRVYDINLENYKKKLNKTKINF